MLPNFIAYIINIMRHLTQFWIIRHKRKSARITLGKTFNFPIKKKKKRYYPFVFSYSSVLNADVISGIIAAIFRPMTETTETPRATVKPQ